MEEISWSQFEAVQLRVGTIVQVLDFPEARKAAYRLLVDFGPDLGMKKSSAQLTAVYTKESLLGSQVVGVVNFPPKQIGPFMSEVLITGFANDNGDIVLCTPDQSVPNGSRLM